MSNKINTAIRKNNMYEIDQFMFAHVQKLTNELGSKYVHFLKKSTNLNIAYVDLIHVLPYADFKLRYPIRLVRGILGLVKA